MSYYVNYKGNYWDRKVFNTQENFDLSLLKYSELSENISEQLFKKYVELVCLEMSYYCNRACNYCPVHDLERSDKDLEIPEDIFVSVLNSLNKIDYKERISLNLFNEPLASKNFHKNVSRIKQKVPKAILSLGSSGDYIKSLDDLKKLDNCGVNEILFTMHTPKDKAWNREYCERRIKQLKHITEDINYIPKGSTDGYHEFIHSMYSALVGGRNITSKMEASITKIVASYIKWSEKMTDPKYRENRKNFIETTISKIGLIKDKLHEAKYTQNYTWDAESFLDSIEEHVRKRAKLSEKQFRALNKMYKQYCKKVEKNA